ncbi:MAG: amino acid adenylation domain-containing protein [Chlamydiia bacterium]|nr:amino acid adenylation domain-containing protein [Chlamydiia bacterium]
MHENQIALDEHEISSEIEFGFKSPSTKGGRLETEFALSKGLRKKMEEYCIEEGVSRDQLFLGVFQALIYRYSGQNDFGIAIGSQGNLGFLHLECRGHETFRNLIARLKRTCSEGIEKSPQVVYWMDEPVEKCYELELFFVEREGKLVGKLWGAESVFYQKSIQEMGRHFLRFLEKVIVSDSVHLDDVMFLSKKEEDLLYHTLPKGEPMHTPENILDLFQEVVKAHGDKVAVQDEMKPLTYQELDEASNQMAHLLIKNGVECGDVVGVCLHHQTKLVVLVIALIKIGATYLPLDPSYPMIRIKGMIQDAKPKVVVSQSEFRGLLERINVKQLFLDKVEVDGFCKNSVSTTIDLEQTAYIIYTSGSTGRPKGIMIAYRSLPHLSLERVGFYPKETRSILLGSIGFDISPLTIFHTLMTGGSLLIPDEAKRVDGKALLEFIESHHVNYMMCVPSFYAMVLEKGASLPKSLEIVSLVGEQIPHSLPPLHAKLGPHTRLYNEYGPCEIAIGSSYALIYDPRKKKINPITIGRPLPNTNVYVLCPNLLSALPQMKGEICIGGMGVAKGYLNNKKLSQEKFVTIKLPGNKQTRVYRTGDFGRYLPNGNLEFLGRMDYQVKLRGHRIELGEIESILRRHEDIDDAVVVFDQKENILIAYYTTILGKDLSSEIIRNFLVKCLPRYMIPTHFMQLKKFPRTLIQKVDRKALPKIGISIKHPTSVAENDIEGKLITIWKEVLKRDDVSREGNFFDLGGNSLLLANVQMKIEELFGIQIPLIEFFGAASVKDFAKLLQKYIQEKGRHVFEEASR